MGTEQEFSFKITPYTPSHIPMARLAEYMLDFAHLLGNERSVHFLRVSEGSTCLVCSIEPEAVPKAVERCEKARNGSGPSEAVNAITRINRKLEEDGGDGVVIKKAGAEIIRFPGKRGISPLFSGNVHQEDILDGYIVRLGGRNENVPIHFESRDGRAYSGTASRTIARALGRHLFGSELRLYGNAIWEANQQGNWALVRFVIQRFDILEDENLLSVVSRLREVKGSDWDALEDPWSALKALQCHESEGIE